MKTFGRFLLPLLAFTIVALFAALAIAQTATGAPIEDAGLDTGTMIAIGVATLLSFGARKAAPSSTFLHTAWGATLLAFLSTAGTVAVQAFTAHGFSKKTLISALFAAVMSFASTADPKPVAAKLPALLFFVALSLGATGCPWGTCELGKLPQTLQSVVASVVAIVSNSSTYVDDLITLGKEIGPGQVDCVAQALADAGTPVKGMRVEQQPWAAKNIGRLKEYLVLRKSQGAKLCDPREQKMVRHAGGLWAHVGPPGPAKL
jgi:hypothetical protein